MSLIGNLNLLIGIRLHALIFAALMHVPFIGISYDPKITSFLHMIEQEPIGTMTELDSNVLYNRCVELLQSTESYQHSFNRIQTLRKVSKRNAEFAISLLQEY